MTTRDHIIYNMIKNGNMGEEDNMGTYITFDGQYRFELKRENYQLWFTDTSYKYKCIINIYNNITDNLLVSLNCTEEDIMNILDCYTQANDFGCPSIFVPALKPYNSNGNFYIIELEAFRINRLNNIMEDVSNRWFNVKEYNPLLQAVVDIVSIQLDLSEIEELMDLLYFIFLIDLESENPLIPYNMVPSEYSRYTKDNIGVDNG